MNAVNIVKIQHTKDKATNSTNITYGDEDNRDDKDRGNKDRDNKDHFSEGWTLTLSKKP
jgi:hypothetical protein